jgi:hypothetical protein
VDSIVECNCSPGIVGPDLLKRTVLLLSHFFAYRYTTIRSLKPLEADVETDASADKPLILARSMHPVVYQSYIATTYVRGSVRLLNTKRSMLKIMELLEPLAARDRGGV